MIDPLDRRSTFGYDANGRQVYTEDAEGNRTTMVYDEAGRQIAVEDAENRRTTSVFDGVGRMIALVDANSRRTTFQYDAAGSKSFEVDPLLRRTTYAYDNVGRPTVKHDARDNRITTVYDEAGRPTRKELPAGVRHTFGYDSLDRQTLLADPTGRYTTTYDKRGLATRVENPNQKTITYAYDVLGRQDYMINPDDGRTTYAYDAASRMTSLKNPLGERTTWTYDNLGRTTEQQLANGSKATYTFDPAGQLTRLANVKSDDSPISTFDYSYDNVGNRTAVTESRGDRVTWSYDKTYQLTREQRDDADGSGSAVSCGSYDVTHTYDPAGNRLVKNDSGSRTTSTYDAANQLATSEDQFGTTTYEYDATGNLQYQHDPDGGRVTNTWDAENRLTLAETPTAVNTMTYRGDGLRVKKEDGTGTSKFVWDGQNVLLETDAGDVTQAAYTLKPAAYGNLLSQRRKVGELWVPHFFHFDALGSTDRLTDALQEITDSYCYQAYGKLLGSSGNTVNPFLWVGQVGYFEDAELEQYYVRARHYEPVLARWLSEDPLGYHAGINQYEYIYDSPVNDVDPSGTLANNAGAGSIDLPGLPPHGNVDPPISTGAPCTNEGQTGKMTPPKGSPIVITKRSSRRERCRYLGPPPLEPCIRPPKLGYRTVTTTTTSTYPGGEGAQVTCKKARDGKLYWHMTIIWGKPTVTTKTTTGECKASSPIIIA